MAKTMAWMVGHWGGLVSLFMLVAAFLWFKEMKREKKKKTMMLKDGDCVIPNGTTGWPLVGETLEFIVSGYSDRPVTFMEKRRRRYGKVFRTHLLGTPIIVSTDAEVNKVILQNHGCSFVPAYPKSIREILGKSSILQLDGQLHKRVHSLIGAFFKSPHLKAQATRDMEEAVKVSLASWKNHSVVLVQEETKNITFQFLVKLLMGVGPGAELDFLKCEFREMVRGLICLPINLPGTRMHKTLKAKDRIVEVIKKRVRERMGEERETQPVDVVELLLREGSSGNEGHRFTVDFVSENILGMMIPGEETMPTAMTLAVKYLSDSPAALQRTMEENMQLKNMKQRDGSLEYTWMDYMSLPFTQKVINETLRLANIINGIWRKAVKDVKIKEYLIPQGWCILASLLSVHMDEEIYDNPYHFDPWRWEGNGVAASNINFAPFGGGQRLCPGFEVSRLEISIFLHHLLTTYRWVAEEDDIVSFPTVKMRKSLPIRVKPISI